MRRGGAAAAAVAAAATFGTIITEGLYFPKFHYTCLTSGTFVVFMNIAACNLPPPLRFSLRGALQKTVFRSLFRPSVCRIIFFVDANHFLMARKSKKDRFVTIDLVQISSKSELSS